MVPAAILYHPSADIALVVHGSSIFPWRWICTALLVVVPPDHAVDVVRQAAAHGIRHVWLQQGAQSAEILCVELGLDTVAGECILMFAKPTGVHKAHWWVWRLLGKLPEPA